MQLSHYLRVSDMLRRRLSRWTGPFVVCVVMVAAASCSAAEAELAEGAALTERMTDLVLQLGVILLAPDCLQGVDVGMDVGEDQGFHGRPLGDGSVVWRSLA